MTTKLRIFVVGVLLALVVGFAALRVHWDERREPLFNRDELTKTFVETITVPGLIIGSIGIAWIMYRHREHRRRM